MSARRSRVKEDSNIFQTDSVLPLAETDASIFGDLDRVDAGRVNVKPINIFDIFPDVLQPRRAVPTPVRSYWDGRPSTISDLFTAWYNLAVEERGYEFDIEPYLIAKEEALRPEKEIGPVESSFLEIVSLAANIRANGLTNPITVAHMQSRNYRLETGERRWLAYHFLYISFVDEQDKWGRISARVMDQFSVWRQASENNARANLNAISKARQLALLIMEVLQEQGQQFAPFERIVQTGDSDRSYYAQVADGEAYPLPRHSVETILNAAGFKSSSQLREHRSLLRLPDEVWKVADDLNWTQGKIRQLQRLSDGDDKKLISLALQEASAIGYQVGIAIPDSPTPPRRESFDSENALFSAQVVKRLQRLKSLAKRVGEGGKVKDIDLIEIGAMRNWLNDWLNDMEKSVRSQMKK